MSNFLNYLNRIWNNYPIEFIAFILSVFWGLLSIINNNLPVYLKLNKKYSFWKKVKHTICSINVSIRCNKTFTSSQIKNKLSMLLRDSFKSIHDENGKFIFKSLQTDSTYILEIGEKLEDDNYSIIIKNDNAFKTSRLGRIKGLQDLLNELQKIINLFSGDKVDTEKVTSQIRIFPQKEGGVIKDNLEIKMQERDCYISCTKDMIHVVTKGIPNSKNSIERALHKWIEFFI